MNLKESQGPRPVGRPRSNEAHKAILAATVELLAEEGFEGTSLEAVSNRAGVGKTTIYRRWSSKEALVLDALKALDTEVQIVDTGNFREDTVAFLHDLIHIYLSNVQPKQPELLLRTVGELYAHPDLFSTLYVQLYEPRTRQLEHLITRAQARGELRQDLDAMYIMDLIAGPLLLCALLSTIRPAKNTLEELTELTVDAVMSGIGLCSQPTNGSCKT